MRGCWCRAFTAFLSTFPLRGTSPFISSSICGILISIHVPLAGNVTAPVCWSRSKRDFYPRSPCGERPAAWRRSTARFAFLSTFPLRGTSGIRSSLPCCGRISIHVPLAGNVTSTPSAPAQEAIFLSTFPLRGTSITTLSLA